MKVLDRTGMVAVTRPNWGNEVSQDYTFKTHIFKSRNGTERREALRRNARIAIQFQSVLPTAAMHRFMQDLQEQPDRIFIVPTRWRSTFMDAANLVGATTISVPTPPFWLVAGTDIVITNETVEEAATVVGVDGSTITLADDLVNAFAAGSRVMAAYRARAAAKPSVSAVTAAVAQAAIRYDVDPGSDPQATPSAAPATFEGRELFLTEPNWRDGISVELESLRELADNDRGVIETFSPWTDLARIQKMGYTGMSASAVDDLVAFFLRHKGRRTGFFMPSWQPDVTPKQTAAAASSALLVAGIDFLAAYEDSKTFNVLYVRYPNGDYQVNRIVSIALSGVDSELTMRDSWDQDVTPDTRVSFCHHWRFATDTLSVAWQTSEVAEIEIAVQTTQTNEDD